MPRSPTFTCGPLPLDRRSLSEAAVVGARAFHDDPFFTYIAPEPMSRARGLAVACRSHLAAFGPTAVATGARDAGGALIGVSVWQRPGTHPLPMRSQLRELGGAVRSMATSPRSLPVAIRYFTAIEKARPHEDHWYLAYLVTDPTWWRRGVGTALLEPALEIVDADGLPAYLETQKEDNLAYYGRFGFEETLRLHPQPGGPPLHTLTRPAR